MLGLHDRPLRIRMAPQGHQSVNPRTQTVHKLARVIG